MENIKLTFYFFIVIATTIVIGVLICSSDNCCIDSDIAVSIQTVNSESSKVYNESNGYNELQKILLSYALDLKDSINKQDSLDIANLTELTKFIQRSKKKNKVINDSCVHCICTKGITYEFSNQSYKKIQQQLYILQKNISSRNKNFKKYDELVKLLLQN